MTFLELRQRVGELSGLDETQTDTDTRIKEWINQAYQEVSSFYEWPWLIKEDIIQTVAEITTGTVSVTNGSTAIVFSSAPTISVQSQFDFQVDSDQEWYNIASHTAASVNATLNVPYLKTTDGTATYKLRKVRYSLPTDFDRVQFMRQTEDKVLLAELRKRDLFHLIPDPQATNQPRFYYFDGLDSNKNWQVGLYPISPSATNVILSYFKEITELSDNDDKPDIPDKFHNVLVFGALALYGYSFIDDSRIREARQSFVKILDEMRKTAGPGKDSHTVIQPWDHRPGNRLRGPRLPSNFGPNFFGFG